MIYDLSDVTFMMPVRIDSEDRINNLNIVATYLRTYFNTTIIIAEQDRISKIPKLLCKTLYDTYIYYKSEGNHFHKTRLINEMIRYAKTPIVAMCDADVLCEPHQYIQAVNEIRNNQVDFIYPFNGKCVNIQKQQIPEVLERLKFNFVRVKFTNKKALAMGGCVIYNKDKFIEGGMMNEYFVSYGPEDAEQDMRLKKLGYRTKRVEKPLFHLNHSRTMNSQEGHEYTNKNWEEIRKIKRMRPEILKEYVSTWPWIREIDNG